VCATSTTSASGAASRAARKPPGRGASTLRHRLGALAIAPCPACAAVDARCRRCGVKLPPSGRSRRRRSRRDRGQPAICARGRSPCRVGEMNRPAAGAGPRRCIGSQARVSLSTTRGSRLYQCISAWMSVNVSPGPACRQGDQDRHPGVRVRRRARSRSAAAAPSTGLAERSPTSRPARGRSGCPRQYGVRIRQRTRRQPPARNGRSSSRLSQVR
jgi:hypothetical protein